MICTCVCPGATWFLGWVQAGSYPVFEVVYFWRASKPRAANAHCAEVYIRPARGFDWPMVFLDDVATPIALEAVDRHGGLAAQTSPAGGCHLWLPFTRPLDEDGRHRVQRWLAGWRLPWPWLAWRWGCRGLRREWGSPEPSWSICPGFRRWGFTSCWPRTASAACWCC